jgi:hypothetical protein
MGDFLTSIYKLAQLTLNGNGCLILDNYISIAMRSISGLAV